jgi:hypothetical protein
MKQIFISYSRKDLKFVRKLAEDIKMAGLSVWWDVSDIPPGGDWPRQIQSALEKSFCCLVVLSPDSIKSDWVAKEYTFALNNGIEVIPLHYRSCKLPIALIDLNYIDISNYKLGTSKLLDYLKTQNIFLEASEEDGNTNNINEEKQRKNWKKKLGDAFKKYRKRIIIFLFIGILTITLFVLPNWLEIQSTSSVYSFAKLFNRALLNDETPLKNVQTAQSLNLTTPLNLTLESEFQSTSPITLTETLTITPDNLRIDITNLVNTLYQNSVIQKTNGEYYKIPDQEISGAKQEKYFWRDTGYIVEDFIVTSEMQWDTSYDNTTKEQSGCGYVFRFKDQENHYVVRLNMDGGARLTRVVNDKEINLTTRFYDLLPIHDHNTQLTLVAQGNQLLFYVNGERVIMRSDQSLSKGKLAFAVYSGTNNEPGITCNFQNTALWRFSE